MFLIPMNLEMANGYDNSRTILGDLEAAGQTCEQRLLVALLRIIITDEV